MRIRGGAWRVWNGFGLLTVLLAAAAAVFWEPARPGWSPAKSSGYSEIQPILAKYCYRCHLGERAKGNLDLGLLKDDGAALLARGQWQRIWTRVYHQQMPPPDRPQPNEQERTRLTAWIEQTFGRLPDGSRDPGRVVMRRLTRLEYQNTIRDLVGVDFHAADDFPSDDVGYGFDNIGDVLSLPPILMERYLSAARSILDRAVVSEEQRTPKTTVLTLDDLVPVSGGGRAGPVFVLFASGEAYWEFKAPVEAEYLVRVQASGDQAGPEKVRMGLKIDDHQVATFEVPVPRDRPKFYECRVRLQAGRRRIAAAFLNDYYMPQDPDPANRDRNLVLHRLEVKGPLGVKPPDSHRRIFSSKDPRQILAAFARRAFRRPATPEEIDRYLALFERSRKAGNSFEQAMKAPLQAILVSPHFLFRVETSPGPEISEYELATRLSYFLWSSMPDDELLDLAERKQLRRRLEEQVRRMLKDPRASALAENFGSQWLQIRRLAVAAPDPRLFPEFDEDLRQAMYQEAIHYLEAIFREDRDLLELLDSNFTFLNERLARHYGIEGVRGPQFRRVPLTDSRRGGVLTMAAVLTVSSNATRTSPSKRGKWVLEVILGTPPPPPLPNVPALKEDERRPGPESLRERLERHRSDPMCASCHQLFDPIGFGFENYDAIGAWRDTENGRPIEARATLPDGRTFDGPRELKGILRARGREFVRCLTEKLMTYALGRGLECYDAPTVREIAAAVERDGRRPSRLIVEIVKSYPFQHKRPVEVSDE